ncbi:hypothetical protein GXW83_09710 [Streptacidiphilus sp. PB12-B1b]|nr:hypothetical protein GXW83_09710 [Streptacidiphilus sp. PB12-B1b]
MSWLNETLVGFDLETTGTDPAESRIVTAALVEAKGGEVVRERGWLADPGVPIPEEAAAIHGVSTARAVAEGRPVVEVADEVAAALCYHWRAGVPVVVFNAPFYPRTRMASHVSRVKKWDGGSDWLDAAGRGSVAAVRQGAM